MWRVGDDPSWKQFHVAGFRRELCFESELLLLITIVSRGRQSTGKGMRVRAAGRSCQKSSEQNEEKVCLSSARGHSVSH